MIAVWIILGIVVLLAIAAILSYNRFVSQRNLIRNAFANIDTELRRRYDLIPNLVETVKSYAAHEREVFEEVARTRSAAAATSGQSPAAQAAAEGPFVAALGRLFAVAENYPDLKANQNFLALQGELTNTEDRIQTARRFYNNNVQDYNRRVQSFPSNVIAGTFHFKEEEFFEIPDQIRDAGPPQVSFAAGSPGVSFGQAAGGGAVGGGAGGASTAPAVPPQAPPPAATPPAGPSPGGAPPANGGGGFTG
ncbi:MAG TPA: LemA family protein [Actinomycetota bacterium]|nr:LemA family protein [Actinomycetota bacterium]